MWERLDIPTIYFMIQYSNMYIHIYNKPMRMFLLDNLNSRSLKQPDKMTANALVLSSWYTWNVYVLHSTHFLRDADVCRFVCKLSCGHAAMASRQYQQNVTTMMPNTAKDMYDIHDHILIHTKVHNYIYNYNHKGKNENNHKKWFYIF